MSDARQTRAVPSWLPPSHVIVALTLGLILFAITVGKGVRDPDYFWHVVAGEWIATNAQVPSVDPFSFTWNGQPWTPHEWLSELLIYGLVAALGETGALAVFALVPGATILVLALLLGRLGVRTWAQAPILGLAALVISPYATLRPQALSWFLLAVTVALLATVRPDSRRRLLLLFPLFVAWANIHGLYIVGIGVVGAHGLFTLLGRMPLAGYRQWAVAAVALAVIGAMLTPAGPLGVLYPLRYGQEWGLANIQEWQSPDFHSPAHWPLLALIVALILNGGRAAPGWLQLVAYVGTVMALVALRNSPVAAVLAAPTLALGLEDRLREWRGAHRPAVPKMARARRVMEGLAALVVVTGALVIFLPPGITTSPAEQQLNAGYPVEAVDLLAESQPTARVVPEYGWGGYVIYRLYEGGGRVFIDGRNDMYAEQILDDYTTISLADDGWEDLLDQYGADALLFPPTKPITKGIAEAAGWCEAYRDDDSVLLLRDCPG
jgi:hypothetical protein